MKGQVTLLYSDEAHFFRLLVGFAAERAATAQVSCFRQWMCGCSEVRTSAYIVGVGFDGKEVDYFLPEGRIVSYVA